MPGPLDNIAAWMAEQRAKAVAIDARKAERIANPGKSYAEPIGDGKYGLDSILTRLSQKFGDTVATPGTQSAMDMSEGARTLLDMMSPVDLKTGLPNMDTGNSHAAVPFALKASRRVKIASKLDEIASKAMPIVTERPMHQAAPQVEKVLTEKYGPLHGPSVPKVSISSPDPYHVNSNINNRDVDFHSTKLEFASDMLDGGQIGRQDSTREAKRSTVRYKYAKSGEEPFKSLSYNNATPMEVYDSYVKAGYKTDPEYTKASVDTAYKNGDMRYIDIPQLFRKEYTTPSTTGVSTMRQPKVKNTIPSDVIFSLRNDALRGTPRRGYAEGGYTKMLSPEKIGLMTNGQVLSKMSSEEVVTYNSLKKQVDILSQGPDEINGYDAAIEKLDNHQTAMVNKYAPEKVNKANTGYEFENRTFNQNIPLNKKTAGPIYVNLDKLRERPAIAQNAYRTQNILDKAKEFGQPVIGFNSSDWEKTRGSVNRMKMLTRTGLETGKIGQPIKTLEDIYGNMFNDLKIGLSKPEASVPTTSTHGPVSLDNNSLIDHELNSLYKLDDPIVGPVVKKATEDYKKTSATPKPSGLGAYIDENLHKYWSTSPGQTLGPDDTLHASVKGMYESGKIAPNPPASWFDNIAKKILGK